MGKCKKKREGEIVVTKKVRKNISKIYFNCHFFELGGELDLRKRYASYLAKYVVCLEKVSSEDLSFSR